MLLNCGVGEDSCESLGLQGYQTSSILKEISTEYSLEGLMLKLKLQYVGHLMQRTDSFKKTLTTRAPPPAWEGSCHGELGGLFCEAAEAQEGAAGAHHPQECRGGAEAQVGTAHEEPG